VNKRQQVPGLPVVPKQSLTVELSEKADKMNEKKYCTRRSQSGFTLIELLVVIAIIALLMSVIMPALSKAKEKANKVICSNQQRQIGLSLLMYADANNGVIAPNSEAGWLWDVTYATTDCVIDTGGDRRTFYCPLDKTKSSEMMNFWRYSEGAGPDDSESSLGPEPTTGREKQYRVTGYFWLLDRKVGGSLPLAGGLPEFEWPRKITDINNPSVKELVTDAILSDGLDPQTANFTEIRGGSFTKWGIYDRTNHVGRDQLPMDSNILFADGHVARRRFDTMRVWVGRGGNSMPYHWW